MADSFELPSTSARYFAAAPATAANSIHFRRRRRGLSLASATSGLLLLLLQDRVTCVHAQSAAKKSATVRSLEELQTAANDDGVEHIVLADHINTTGSGKATAAALLQPAASTKVIRVRCLGSYLHFGHACHDSQPAAAHVVSDRG